MDGEGMQVSLTHTAHTSLVRQKEMKIDILKRELKSSNKALIIQGCTLNLNWTDTEVKTKRFVLK